MMASQSARALDASTKVGLLQDVRGSASLDARSILCDKWLRYGKCSRSNCPNRHSRSGPGDLRSRYSRVQFRDGYPDGEYCDYSQSPSSADCYQQACSNRESSARRYMVSNEFRGSEMQVRREQMRRGASPAPNGDELSKTAATDIRSAGSHAKRLEGKTVGQGEPLLKAKENGLIKNVPRQKRPFEITRRPGNAAEHTNEASKQSTRCSATFTFDNTESNPSGDNSTAEQSKSQSVNATGLVLEPLQNSSCGRANGRIVMEDMRDDETNHRQTLLRKQPSRSSQSSPGASQGYSLLKPKPNLASGLKTGNPKLNLDTPNTSRSLEGERDAGGEEERLAEKKKVPGRVSSENGPGATIQGLSKNAKAELKDGNSLDLFMQQADNLVGSKYRSIFNDISSTLPPGSRSAPETPTQGPYPGLQRNQLADFPAGSNVHQSGIARQPLVRRTLAYVHAQPPLNHPHSASFPNQLSPPHSPTRVSASHFTMNAAGPGSDKLNLVPNNRSTPQTSLITQTHGMSSLPGRAYYHRANQGSEPQDRRDRLWNSNTKTNLEAVMSCESRVRNAPHTPPKTPPHRHGSVSSSNESDLSYLAAHLQRPGQFPGIGVPASFGDQTVPTTPEWNLQRCFNCFREGHIAMTCHQPQRNFIERESLREAKGIINRRWTELVLESHEQLARNEGFLEKHHSYTKLWNPYFSHSAGKWVTSFVNFPQVHEEEEPAPAILSTASELVTKDDDQNLPIHLSEANGDLDKAEANGAPCISSDLTIYTSNPTQSKQKQRRHRSKPQLTNQSRQSLRLGWDDPDLRPPSEAWKPDTLSNYSSGNDERQIVPAEVVPGKPERRTKKRTEESYRLATAKQSASLRVYRLDAGHEFLITREHIVPETDCEDDFILNTEVDPRPTEFVAQGNLPNEILETIFTYVAGDTNAQMQSRTKDIVAGGNFNVNTTFSSTRNRRLQNVTRSCRHFCAIAQRILFKVVCIDTFPKLNAFVELISKDRALAHYVHIMRINLEPQDLKSNQKVGRTRQPPQPRISIDRTALLLVKIIEACGNMQVLSVNMVGSLLGFGVLQGRFSNMRELQLRDTASKNQVIKGLWDILKRFPHLRKFKIIHSPQNSDVVFDPLQIPVYMMSTNLSHQYTKLSSLTLESSPEISDDILRSLVTRLPELSKLFVVNCKLVTSGGFARAIAQIPNQLTTITFWVWVGQYGLPVDKEETQSDHHLCSVLRDACQNVQNLNLKLYRVCSELWNGCEFQKLEYCKISLQQFLTCNRQDNPRDESEFRNAYEVAFEEGKMSQLKEEKAILTLHIPGLSYRHA